MYLQEGSRPLDFEMKCLEIAEDPNYAKIMLLKCNHRVSCLEHFLHYHFIHTYDDEQMVPVSQRSINHSQMLFENTVGRW